MEVGGMKLTSRSLKRIQQRLMLLLHSYTCTLGEEEGEEGVTAPPCTVQFCDTVKSVLRHMANCRDARNCQREC